MSSTYNFKKILEEFEKDKVNTGSTENKLDRSSFEKDIKNSETLNESPSVTKDVALSTLDGAGEGAAFLLIDLPTLISNGFLYKDKMEKEVAMRATKLFQDITGASDEELAETEKNILALKDYEYKSTGLKKYLKKNVLSYEPKTPAGKIVNEAAEFALPSFVLSPAGARTAMTVNAAAAGSFSGAAQTLGASEEIAVPVAATLNLAADVLALKKGNASTISKTIVESMSAKQLDEAKKLQTLAKNSGLDLKASEVMKGSVINSVEKNVTTIPIAQKIINKFWESRPEKLKNYINKWGKELGILKKNKFISQSTQSQTLKKVAINLDKSRSDIWLKSGGADVKLQKFKPVQVQNISNDFKSLIKDANSSFVPTIKNFQKLVMASKGNGQALINISHDLQAMKSASIYRKSLGQAKAGEALDLAQITKMDAAVTKLLDTMPGYAKAQKAYSQFTKKWVEPIDKVKLFKNIKEANFLKNDVEVGKFYKYIASEDVSKIDIKNLAQAFEKSGSKTEFRKLLSAYFETNMNKAYIKGMENGISDGASIYKAMLGSGTQRGNFAELLYQLGKQNNKNISRKDIGKVVDNFAQIIKASGKKVPEGSDTAAKLMAQGEIGKNWVQNLLGFKDGLPIAGGIVRSATEATTSRNAKILAEALVSPNGVEEIIKLSKTGLKDPDMIKATLINILKTQIETGDEE